jgi:hypothetical protein
MNVDHRFMLQMLGVLLAEYLAIMRPLEVFFVRPLEVLFSERFNCKGAAKFMWADFNKGL